MTRSHALVLSLALALTTLIPIPGTAQPDPCEGVEPYVFLLFDTSSSMNESPPCTASQITAGDCSFLCPGGDCLVPRHADSPDSKLHQVKEALFTAVSANPPLHFGFASFDQSELGVETKHWDYAATSSGPTIPGWGPFPAVGAQEVFGRLEPCTGGCTSTSPAILTNAGQLTQIQRQPKGGTAFNQVVTVFVRQGSFTYRVRYTPVPGTLGNSTVQTTVNVVRCNNLSCSANSPVGQTVVNWGRIEDFLLRDPSSDVVEASTCNGWDPNDDGSSDPFGIYNLRWPTDSSDLRGTPFSQGDVLPLDWLDDHQADILTRLAPNLSTNPLATPDFRIAPYFQDFAQAGETFLRLHDESNRPLIPIGFTPHGTALQDFQAWHANWQAIAETEDPDWLCRRQHLIVLTDGDDNCETAESACEAAEELYTQEGLQTHVVAFGVPFSGISLECMAEEGGTVAPSYPQTKQELIDTLDGLFASIANP